MNDFINEEKIDNIANFEESMKDDATVEAKIQKSQVGMVFDSIDDLMKYYIKYGNEKRFPVKKRSSAKGDDGQVRWVAVACSRSGQTKSRSKNSFKMHPSSKTIIVMLGLGLFCP